MYFRIDPHHGNLLRTGSTRFLWIHTAGLLALCAAVSAAGATKGSAKQKSPKPAASAPKTPAPKPASPAPSDTSRSDSTTVGVKIYEYIAYPTLQLVTWPVQNVLAPGVELLTYPSQEPIRYFLEENVIDRTVDLFSFGSRSNVMVYPTISLASGTASRVGTTLRNEAPFARPNERLVAYLNYYVNGDFRLRSYLTSRELAGTSFDGKVSAGLSRIVNTQFYEPERNNKFYYAVSSESYMAQLEHPVVEDFRLRGAYVLRVNRHSDAPPPVDGTNTPQSDFFRDENGVLDPRYRGLNQDFLDHAWSASLVRDTRNNDNIPVAGSWFDVSGYWHEVQLDHDYYEVKGRYTKFFKLGRERYEISANEEKNRSGLNLNEFIRTLEYERLRKQFFSRKVVVAHMFGAQSFERPGNSMPLYGLQTLGNENLRGYAGPRFRNYAVAGASLEYRFPILRIMDGTLFNEYGVYGRSLDELDVDNLKNSWGFGIRVRRPDMFLFRVEVGIHGFSGVVLNATADAPF